jgi:cell division protein FtsI/penicillin-binding protein 2
MKISRRNNAGWRAFQKQLKREARRKYLLKNLPAWTLYAGGACLALILILSLGAWISGHFSESSFSPSETKKSADIVPEKKVEPDPKKLLRELNLATASLTDHFVMERGEARLSIDSSLDSELQSYILQLLRRSKTLQAAVVVLQPEDGRVLAMASYQKEGNGENLCVKAEFPAASIFKIVSAAAALESAGFSPDKPVFFQGRRHTLYKQQLKQMVNKYTNKTSFKKAFALSINPVFGKLGIYDLGQELMAEYADRFLFNEEIPFDFPVAKSTIEIPNEEYGLAEIASGFNKKTMISPLHAAMLTSVVANDGIMMTPWLVQRISNESGESLYERRPNQLTAPVTRETAEDLKILMRGTVVYGTCRKSFRSLRRKKAFKDVDFGAKTGTINDIKDQVKFDWFAGYALPENNSKAMSIAVLGIHGEKLGLRSSELGRYIIQHYLKS